MSALEVDNVHMYPMENAVQHHTDFYEIVHRDPATPVLRRGQSFYIAIRFKNRSFHENSDVLRLIFNYGK